MNEDFAMKWADALESGQYKQCKGKLFDGEAYCCLGVACVLLGIEFELNKTVNACFKYRTKDEGAMTVLPTKAQLELHVDSACCFVDSLGVSQSLTNLNDEGKTFPIIAQVIRENYKNFKLPKSF